MIASLLLTIALSAAQAQSDAFVWRTLVPGESVQWGDADGTRLGLRIRCRPGRRLEMLGPIAADALPGAPIRLTFRRGEERVALLAVTVDGEGGLNFAVPLAAGELPIATLLAGATLTVSDGDESREVSGAGAPAVLAPLVEACRR